MISSQILPDQSPISGLDAQRALYVPVGLASPLWFVFAGAASAGVAYWWLNRWREATNLEALLAPRTIGPEPEVVILEAEPAVETPEPVTAEPVVGQTAEPALEPVVEAVPAKPKPSARRVSSESDPA